MFEHRIFRCGKSDYYRDEILRVNDTHREGQLRALADAGFNGIWLRGELRNLTPTDLFKPYVRRADERVAALAKFCRRAERYGLGVWLYFTEPLGLPQSHRFWKAHPDLAGQSTTFPLEPEPGIALCPSTPQVQRFLREGFETLFKKAALAGAILITASEHISHCWAHVLARTGHYPCPEPFWNRRCTCRRCSPRGPIDVVADIVSTIHTAVKTARPEANVVAWDWSWNMYLKPPYRKLIERLPSDVILMGDFERGGMVRRAGKRMEVEEYSLAFPGPSPRFRDEAKLVRGKRRLWAKLQVNTTHELATVPNLPLVVALYRKLKFLRDARAAGYMGTWNFACDTDTLNIFAVKRLSDSIFDSDERRWLEKLAAAFFGRRVDAAGVVKAWYEFQHACRSYPINGNRFVYFSPVNYALVYPLKLKFDGTPMGWSHVKHEFGDRLEDTLGDLTFKQMITLLQRLSSRWARAVQTYGTALRSADRTDLANKELGVAVTAGCAFRSTYNIYRWYASRKARRSRSLSAEDRQIVADEIANLREALPWVADDPRLGFHQEPQRYLFTAAGIRRKLRELKALLQ